MVATAATNLTDTAGCGRVSIFSFGPLPRGGVGPTPLSCAHQVTKLLLLSSTLDFASTLIDA